MDITAFFDNYERHQEITSRRVDLAVTTRQWNLSVKLATRRNAKESRLGAMTYGRVRKGLEAHLIGLVPEIAVARVLGTTVDKRIFARHGDQGVDLRTRKYGLVGIKTTTFGEQPLLRVEVEHFKEQVDSYILCFYDPARDPITVSVVGWATKEEVKNAGKRKFVEDGPVNFVIAEEQLHPFETERSNEK